ncbi:MAG TPA: type II secretion system protein GspC [Polyangia bacterium]|nr:type II secretion system protein GspC [Polyangia bacterium]
METLLRKYLWAIDLAVIAICAVFSARATATLIETKMAAVAPPAKPAPRPMAAVSQTVYTKEYVPLLKRNMFCSTCPPIIPEPKTVPDGPPPPIEPQRTTLPLKLLAIMYSPKDPLWSMAIIRDTDEKSSGAFGLGSKIRGARVIDITDTRVDFEVNGRQEYLELFDKGPAPNTPVASAPVAPSAPSSDPLAAELDKGVKKTGEHSYEVQRATVDSLLGNMSALSRAARIVPEVRDGRAAGFRLFSVRPDGPFAKIGLQNGDVISAINGLEMTTPDNALMVYTKLKSASHLSVGLERNGQKITKEYNIR